MKKAVHLAAISIAGLTTAAGLWAQAMPKMNTVTPAAAKIGDVLTVDGENLDKSAVAELYLTDGKNDFKVVMDEQTAKSIRFKVPKTAKPGRFNLMVLTTGKEPKLIEQPVKVNIDGES